MKWNPEEVKERAESDFEKSWMQTIDLVEKPGSFKLKDMRKSLAVFDLVEKARQSFLAMGFKETNLPVFVEDKEVEASYGPEAPLVLDDVYYIAEKEKPVVTIGDDQAAKIRAIAPSFDDEKRAALEKVLKEYTRGELRGSKIVGAVVGRVGLRMEQVTQVMNLFPELAESGVKATKMSLRSPMTDSWFETLAALAGKEPMPLQLFNVGMRFTREKKVTPLRVRAHITASCVVLDEKISLEDGMTFSKALLEQLGLKSVELKKAKATGKHFIPGTQYNACCGKVRVATLGMFSPIALSNYGIEFPVFRLSFGIERAAMALFGKNDVREVLYPQFYGDWALSDEEIAGMVKVKVSPSTELGRDVSKKILKTCELYALHKGPTEFKAAEREFGDQRVEVSVVQEQEGKPLCGPACLDEVFVLDGNVVSLPPSGKDEPEIARKARKEGKRLGFGPLKAFADYVGYCVEKEPLKEREFSVGVFDAEDVNIEVPALLKRYALANEKALTISGKLGLTIKSKSKRLWHHEQPR